MLNKRESSFAGLNKKTFGVLGPYLENASGNHHHYFFFQRIKKKKKITRSLDTVERLVRKEENSKMFNHGTSTFS